MDTAEDIRTAIHQFLGESVAVGLLASICDDTPIRTSGIIDSVNGLRLIGFIEERFSIEVKADEAVAENLDCIGNIIRFVQRKQAK